MVALLAAVPKVHLISGKAVAEGYGKVAFGTDKMKHSSNWTSSLKASPRRFSFMPL